MNNEALENTIDHSISSVEWKITSEHRQQILVLSIQKKDY